MSILNQIVEAKQLEIAERQALVPAKLLAKSPYYESETVSLVKYLRRPDKSGVIAEIKRRSPSRGVINQNISVEELSIGYMRAGASALSILTDQTFFGGTLEDLKIARRFNFCPILRKDFILDEYQILEAKSFGADAVLLIARILSPEKVGLLARFARSLNLEVLLEVHDRGELQRAPLEEVDILGVNNRDLNRLDVDIARSLELAPYMPPQICRISESGIHSAAEISTLKAHGFDGVLIGETFMHSADPARACAALIAELRSLEVQDAAA